MKYSMFIGRWQEWHKGHQWLIDQQLKNGNPVLICIRDVMPDKLNPYTCEEVYDNLHKDPLLKEFIKLNMVKVIIIPDIESVNYGRGVGYDIIEHFPPPEIKEISATKIRNAIK